MTRPDWCPQDAWEKAVCYLVVDVQDHKAIARAILAERERCVAACDEEIALAKVFGPHHIPIITSVRDRIRQGTTHANT